MTDHKVKEHLAGRAKPRSALVWLGAALLCAAMAGCGGGGGDGNSGGTAGSTAGSGGSSSSSSSSSSGGSSSSSSSGGTSNVPQLVSVSPNQLTVGSGGVILMVSGSEFTAQSVVDWNGADAPTTFVSAGELTARISAAQVASPGAVSVTVAQSPGSATRTSAQTVTITPASMDAVSFQINSAHSGAIQLPPVSFPSAPLWTVRLPGSPSYALIAAGSVFVTVPGSSASQLFALNQSTGTTVWGPVSVGPQATAAYDSGTLFVISAATGSSPGTAEAFDAGTGNVKWSVSIPKTVAYGGGPTASHGYVYFVSGSTLYALAESNGAVAWTGSASNDSAANTPAVTADGVYLTYPCFTSDARPVTGAAVWSNNNVCQGPGGTIPVVANGVIYAPNGFGTLAPNNWGDYAGSILDAETGVLLGIYISDTLPAVDARNAYFLQSGTLRAASLDTNTVLWSFAGDGSLVSCPIVVNQYVFVGSASGNVYALDTTNGTLAWQANVGAPVAAGPFQSSVLPPSGLTAGDGLLVVPAGSTLTAYAISPSGGSAPSASQVQSLSPSEVIAGGDAFALTVSGSNFSAQSLLLWNGEPIPTTFVSGSELTAMIPASTIASAGTMQVGVTPQWTGASSNMLPLTIQAAAPLSVTTLSPASSSVGAGGSIVTLTGSGFSSSDTVSWNGSARPTTYVSASELEVQIQSTDFASPGVALITVNDPSGTGRTSSPLSFSVGTSFDAVSPQISVAHAGAANFPAVSLPPAGSWTATLPEPPSVALIAAGKVFVTVPASAGSQLFALDQATGSISWGPVVIGGRASLAYDSATLFALSQNSQLGVVQALDPLTGRVEWITPLIGFSFSSGVVASNGHVYANSESADTIFALTEQSGAVAWMATVVGQDSTPALTASGLYVAYPYQAFDLDPSSGGILWNTNSGGDGGGGAMPVVSNGLLYAPSGLDFDSIGNPTYGGSIFNAQTGTLQGTYAADVPPAFDPQTGYFLQTGTLNAIDSSTNAVLWSFNGDGGLVTAPIVINQYVAIGSSSGNLYLLDANSGTVAWQTNLGAAIPAGPLWGAVAPLSGLAAGDGLLVAPAGKTLTAYALDPAAVAAMNAARVRAHFPRAGR